MQIEFIGRDPAALARSCQVKVGPTRVLTPTRAIGITRSKSAELETYKQVKTGRYGAFGELYARLQIGTLAKAHDDDSAGRRLQGDLANGLSRLRDEGLIPYLVLAIDDSNRMPLGRLPPPKVLDLVFHLLLGTKENAMLVPPLVGALQTQQEYLDLTKHLRDKIRNRTEAGEKPVAGLVPSSYRLIAPELVEEYWKVGSRYFVFDCENKKFGAYGYMLEKLHAELGKLSKRDKEPYVLHALNARQRTGRGDDVRVNELLASGYGFDSYGPSHGGRQRWSLPVGRMPPPNNHYALSPNTYGYYNLNAISPARAPPDLKSRSSSDLFQALRSEPTGDRIKGLVAAHNIEVELGEISRFPELVQNSKLVQYFAQKPRIPKEVREMQRLGHEAASDQKKGQQRAIAEWFD